LHHKKVSNSGQNAIHIIAGTDLKQFVSFYFTSVLELISYFYLHQGCKLCGMLEDLYLAKNYNAYGKVYGYVCYSNVENVDKTTMALNDVSFVAYRVFANVARFVNSSEVKGKGEDMQVL